METDDPRDLCASCGHHVDEHDLRAMDGCEGCDSCLVAARTIPPGYRRLWVATDEGPGFPCMVQLSDGSQGMTDAALGWRGDPIPRWNGFVAYPLFDRAAVNAIVRRAEETRAVSPADLMDRFEWDGETLTIHAEPYASEATEFGYPYDPERVVPETVAGTKYWAIGACAYTWVEVNPG